MTAVERPPFVTDSPEPPKTVKGERAVARIVAVEKVEGQYGPQYQFDLTLDGSGYKIRAWVRYYEKPGEASELGQLSITVWSHLKKVYTPAEAVAALKEYGRVFVECTGHREVKGKMYPKFKIITTLLPATQEKL